MAKGQLRSNREKKKPKAEKNFDLFARVIVDYFDFFLMRLANGQVARIH